MISENLGEHISAIPGKFRKSNCIVGTYRPPEYKYVNDLVKKLCDWLKREFNYGEGEFTSEELTLITPQVARLYSNLKKASVLRDLKELQELGLLEKVGRKYKANIGALSSMIPQRKNSES